MKVLRNRLLPISAVNQRRQKAQNRRLRKELSDDFFVWLAKVNKILVNRQKKTTKSFMAIEQHQIIKKSDYSRNED